MNELLEDVTAKVEKQREAVTAAHAKRDEEFYQRLEEKIANASKLVPSSGATSQVDPDAGKIVRQRVSKAQHSLLKEAAYRARGALDYALDQNASVVADINEVARKRKQHIDNMLYLDLEVVERERETIKFMKHLIGKSPTSALPPPIKQGFYCDLTPYANNEFRSDPQSRNGAKLVFGTPEGTCQNWNSMGGQDSSCCMVPEAVEQTAHAPWCWTGPASYAYCWRGDLMPASSGWRNKALKPLHDYFTQPFANSAVNDCGVDCHDVSEGAKGEPACLQACFDAPGCVGVNMQADGMCIKVMAFGTCDVREGGRCRTGYSCDSKCSENDRIVATLGTVAWLKLLSVGQ